MPRTAGSISNVKVNWQDLRKIVGDEFQGEVVVNAKWLKGLINPDQTEYKLVKLNEDQISQMSQVTISGTAVGAQNQTQAAPICDW